MAVYGSTVLVADLRQRIMQVPRIYGSIRIVFFVFNRVRAKKLFYSALTGTVVTAGPLNRNTTGAIGPPPSPSKTTVPRKT